MPLNLLPDARRNLWKSSAKVSSTQEHSPKLKSLLNIETEEGAIDSLTPATRSVESMHRESLVALSPMALSD
jgi:hypothetical protein